MHFEVVVELSLEGLEVALAGRLARTALHFLSIEYNSESLRVQVTPNYYKEKSKPLPRNY